MILKRIKIAIGFVIVISCFLTLAVVIDACAELAVSCPKCGKQIAASSETCMFCGAEIKQEAEEGLDDILNNLNHISKILEDLMNSADYNVKNWENSGINYYTVYKISYEEEGAPTFYSEQRDEYNNIYTGKDVKITFYRQYDGATLEKADALCRYLKEWSLEKDRYAGYFYFEEDGFIYQITVFLIEGMNPDETNFDCQYLWDKNPWVNNEDTQLTLEYLDYGLSDATLNYAKRLGCSAAACVQVAEEYGFPGVSFGFHFTEGSDNHTVMRYCPDETW